MAYQPAGTSTAIPFRLSVAFAGPVTYEAPRSALASEPPPAADTADAEVRAPARASARVICSRLFIQPLLSGVGPLVSPPWTSSPPAKLAVYTFNDRSIFADFPGSAPRVR